MYEIIQCDAGEEREITLNELIEATEMFEKDGAFTCDKCGKQDNEIYLTDNGRLCEKCKTAK